ITRCSVWTWLTCSPIASVGGLMQVSPTGGQSATQGKYYTTNGNLPDLRCYKTWQSCETWSRIGDYGTMHGCAYPWYQPTRGGSAVTFKEVLAHVIGWLQQDQRISYRALKRQFALDDDYLEDLKAEIIQAKQVARDEEGVVLIWTG